jgi:hypothetical protein
VRLQIAALQRGQLRTRTPDRNHGSVQVRESPGSGQQGRARIDSGAALSGFTSRQDILPRTTKHRIAGLTGAKELVRMNAFSNIWKHPKTTAAGLLISVATAAGVLSQQGITFGKAGSGTVIALVGALASAMLGLMAKDPATPADPPSSGTGVSDTAKVGVLALIALLMPLPFTSGCSAEKVAQEIVNWTPSLASAVATVDSTAALLDPADAPVFASVTSGFNSASKVLISQAQAYLANPSANLLAQLQIQVVTFEQQVNVALLEAAKIVNPASQRHALAALQAVATVVTAMMSLIASVSSTAAVQSMAAQSQIKLSAVQPMLDDSRSAQLVAVHYEEPVSMAHRQVQQANYALAQAGL